MDDDKTKEVKYLMTLNFNNMYKKISLWISLFLLTGLIPVFSAVSSKSVAKKKENGARISILDSQSNSVLEVSIEELLTGAIAAEMPASYPIEALKAQGVAIFTYFLRSNGFNQVISLNANDDSSKRRYIKNFCYKSKSQRRDLWGKKFDKYENKIKGAVKDIKGKALYYDDKIAFTPFFSWCYKETVPCHIGFWQKLPYLISVSSPECDDKALKDKKITVKIDKSEMQDILEKKFPNKKKQLKSTDPSKWIKINDKTKNGYIIKVEVLGEKIKGSKFESLLKLPSANFSMSYDSKSKTFEISSVGYGHGVGMSQHGAKHFAYKGWKYDQILSHYYPGTEIKEIPLQNKSNKESVNKIDDVLLKMLKNKT